MATTADFQMLNQALQNVGEGALQRKQLAQQHENELRRDALERELIGQRQGHDSAMESAATERNKILQAQSDQKNQPKVQATITHPSGVSMDFIGTPEQLDAMQAKEPGLKISGKKQFSAKFDVGGSSFLFDDPDAAKNFAADMKEKHGIDVYATQPKPAAVQPPKQLVRQVLNPAHVVEGAVNAKEPAFLSLTNTTSALPSQPVAQSAPQIPTIHNQQDYDALAPGAQYVDSLGRKAVKKAAVVQQ